jgi:translation elongation factor EF-Ts
VVSSPIGVVGGYVHNFGSYGAIVELKSKDSAEPLNAEKLQHFQDLASKLAQHIVASDPGDIAQDGLKKLGKQQFVFDSTMNINQLLVKASKQHGQSLAVAHYLRWKCGAN